MYDRALISELQRQLNLLKITPIEHEAVWDRIIAMQDILNDMHNLAFQSTKPDPFA